MTTTNMRRPLLAFVGRSILVLYMIFTFLGEPSHAWHTPPPLFGASFFWQQTAAAAMAVVASTTMTLPSSSLPPPSSSVSPQQSTLLAVGGKEVRSMLKSPTEDRPQIQIPTNLGKEVDKNGPIVEALLYLANPQVRPEPFDTIVVTVRDVAFPEKVLAGAKLPVSKVRFPVQLRLFSQNIVDEQGWNRAGDLVVRAAVCPADSTSVASCADSDATMMQAEGIAKLVRNLPGMPEGTTLRAGAALPLK